MTPEQLIQQLKLLTQANRHAFLKRAADQRIQQKLVVPKPPAS